MPELISSSHLNDVGAESATPWSMENVQANESPLRKPSAMADKFLVPDHQRPAVKHDDYSHLEIPVIDLAAHDTAKESVVAQVREACLGWGFFQSVHHGIEEALLSRVQRQAIKLFTLPYSDKMKVGKPPGKYSGHGHATVKEGGIRPWSEGFYFIDEQSTAEHAQQLWPDGNTEFVDSYREYAEKMKQLSWRLMQIVVTGLEVNPAHFEQYTTNKGGLIRWNYYPACPEPLKTLGLTTHTDFNLLTVVHQGEIGGLQIQKDGEWIAVKPRAGALAVNINVQFVDLYD